MSESGFYLVWSPTGPHPPTYRHLDKGAARKEAERLAILNPGAEFYVLAAVAVCTENRVAWRELEDPQEPPF